MNGPGWKWAVAFAVVVAGAIAAFAVGRQLFAKPFGESGAWERFDLPDPAPGTFAGSRASDVVAFGGGYVAIGGYSASCVSDIHQTPAGCDAALESLPSTDAAVVWLSDDARVWTLVPHQPAFEDGRMDGLATDGARLVATGILRDALGERVPVTWVSGDGRTWQRIESGELLPEHVVSATAGFIGVRATDDGPQFLASDDGRSWRPLTDPGELGPGRVARMSVSPDRMTVVAVGARDVKGQRGQFVGSIPTVWLASDGATWVRAATNDDDRGRMLGVTATDSGWAAIGQVGPRRLTAWTSPDGLTWTHQDTGPDDLAPLGGAEDIAWNGEQLVATGTIGGDGASVIAIWLSDDGATWHSVPQRTAHDEGTPGRIVGFDGWAIASGVRVTGPDHWIGTVWIGSPDQ